MNQTRHHSVDTVRRYVRDAEIWRNNVSPLVLPREPPTPLAANAPPQPALPWPGVP